MIPNKVLKHVLNQEPQNVTELTGPDILLDPVDLWADLPLLRWEGKADTPGNLFFSPEPKARVVVGKELEVIALDVRIKALRLTRSGEATVMLDPRTNGFRYAYLKADERQDIHGPDYYIWGWEFLMYTPTYGRFRVFPTNKSSRIGIKLMLEQADYDLRDAKITTELVQTRLYDWYALRILPMNLPKGGQKLLDFPLE